MKKRIWIPVVVVLLLELFFLPFPTGEHIEGETREYTALTYKIVDWNEHTMGKNYDATRVYFFPNNFKTVDELWKLEEKNAQFTFLATIIEIDDVSALIEPLEEERDKVGGGLISFGVKHLEDIGATVGSVVEITYDGIIMETYPGQIFANSWKLIK